jgi:serine/threonine protein kinase
MSTSLPPTRFGRYTLLRRLAAGGMAEVYLAKAEGQAGFEKRVAVKRLHPAHRGDEPPVSLVEEAKLGVRLIHPNIVQTFDLGRAEGRSFIVMEHVEGYDLEYVLGVLRLRGERLPIDLAVHVVAEVCRGLDFAHRCRDGRGELAGVVHRDVSPQNILLSFAGEVKIADFGIAKTKDRESDPDLQVIKGKYFYMSPEQARAEPLDHRSDIFSAGVVLWELLAGRRLHQAPDVRALLTAVRRAEVPVPSSIRADIPKHLDAVVARATAPSPSARFDRAAEMAQALDRLLARRVPMDAAAEIGALLAGLPPRPETKSEQSPTPLRSTRDRVATASAPPRGTMAEPPLRYDFEDGRPTLVDRRSPSARARRARGWWRLCVGVALFGFAAWLLHGW